MAKQYIQIYYDYLEAIEELTDVERGRLFTALLKYGMSGATEKLNGNERYLYSMMRKQIDRDNKSYDDKCQENRKNGRLGGRPKKPNGLDENQTVFEKPKKKEKEKEKEKDKEKDITPLNPPSGDGGDIGPPKPSQAEQTKTELRAIRNSFVFGVELDKVVNDWLRYKYERRQNYKPTGLKSFLTQVQNRLTEHGEQSIICVITESMASNYDGVTWDKLKKNQHVQQSASPSKPSRYVNFKQRDWDYDKIEQFERQNLSELKGGSDIDG